MTRSERSARHAVIDPALGASTTGEPPFRPGISAVLGAEAWSTARDPACVGLVYDRRSMLEAYAGAFEDPDRCMQRLYALAQRQRWNEDDVPWATLDFHDVPEPIRAGVADLLTQVLYGELAAMLCAARLVQELPDLESKLVCATQVADEAKHVRWFVRLLQKLDRPGRVRAVTLQLMREVYAAPTTEEVVAGMQVLVEGMAHSSFAEAEAMLAESPLATLHAFVARWLDPMVAADERRHVAFGTAWLRANVPTLQQERRDALEATLARWGVLLADTATAPDLFTDYGLPWNRFAARCVADFNARLERCRLQYRLASLETP